MVRRTGWTPRHVAALAGGALLARTLVGFLAPLPQDTTWAAKIGQNVTWLVVASVLVVLMAKRSRARREEPLTDPAARQA